MQLVGLALGLGTLWGLWKLGRWLGPRIRGARQENVIRYDDDFMSLALVFIGFATWFAAAWILHIGRWEDENMPMTLAALMIVGATFLLVALFRFSIVIGPDDIAIKYILRPGWKRTTWSSIRSWKAGRRVGSIIFNLEPKGCLELRSVYKEGFDTLLEAVDRRNIPEGS